MTHKQGDKVWVHRGMYVRPAEIFNCGNGEYLYCRFPDAQEIISTFRGDIFTDRIVAANEMRTKLKQALKIVERQRATLRKIQAEQTEKETK